MAVINRWGWWIHDGGGCSLIREMVGWWLMGEEGGGMGLRKERSAG